MSGDFKPRFLKPSDTSTYLDKTEDPNSADSTTSFVYNRFVGQSIQTQRQRLPIFQNRNHILYLLEKYQTLVLVGETGCGKSTQIPQYLREAEWPDQIVVCEPRRVAAVSLASRVADETGTIVQQEVVGYAVRFDACVNRPKIKYVTEGILIREMMGDPLLKNYSVVMLDEAHERSLYTDILMGLLKKVLKRRKELRLVVASATINAEELVAYFNLAGKGQKETTVALSVHGRQFPVSVYYSAEPIPCYVRGTVDAVLKINSSKTTGDILAFLTGQEEVDRAVRLLKEHASEIESAGKSQNFMVFPMYGSLSYHDQLKVFKRIPDGYRKVVISTNVAETSVTIPGITHVIDCGFVKMKWFNRETHTDSLAIVPVSKASAQQRTGRAGRVHPGHCYRLYTQEDYQKLPDVTPPEIVRANLTYALLQLKALGIDDVLRFDFPSPPPQLNVKAALEILYALDTITIDGELTKPLGFNMAEFALDPLYSKLLLVSGVFGCSEEILTIVSMLQVENVFIRPSTGTGVAQARVQRRNFEVVEGDLVTYLNIFGCFAQSGYGRDFCQRNYFSYKALMRVVEVRQRLERTMKNYGVSMVSCSNDTEMVQRCLVKGLFPNAAYLHYSGVYKTVRGDAELHVHPDSVLYTIQQPQWVLFCEVIHGARPLMRNLTVIKSEWLLELAPHFYHKTTVYNY